MIRKWLQPMLVLLAPFFLLTGCGEEVTAPSQPAPHKVAAPAPTPIASPSVPEVVAPAPPSYVYDPTGRRDPFAPLTMVKKTVGQQETPMTPLQKFDLGQLRLIGVIVGKGEPRAMVVAPDGKSYVLKKGIKVGRNDGTVVDISPEEVSVEERYYDFSGEIRKSIQTIQLPKREGV